MTITPIGPEIATALARWEDLAACAWHGYQEMGRGVLLLDHEELVTAHEAAQRGEAVTLAPTFLPEHAVPKSDDFAPLIRDYDPSTQILLLTKDAHGEEVLLAIESDATRPSPPACHERAAEG